MASARPADFDACRRAFWAFHWGVPPGRAARGCGPTDLPESTWQLGHLVRLELVDGRVVRAPRGVRIVADRYGRNAWFVSTGGVRLPAGFAPGRVAIIVYRSNKGGDVRHTYWHPFEGVRPRVRRDHEGLARFERAGSKYRITWRGFEG